MFQMPMSSPMMTTMLGFCVCAWAGVAQLADNASASNAAAPRTRCLSLIGDLLLSPSGWPDSGRLCRALGPRREAFGRQLGPFLHHVLSAAPLPLRGRGNVAATDAAVDTRRQDFPGH